MKILLKGEVNFVESHFGWIVNVCVKWNRRITTININSRKSDLEDPFLYCSLTKSQLFTFLSRSETYKFKGEKSKFSELLLECAETELLMDSKNPSIKLEEKSLVFKGGIRNKDNASLSNIFILFEVLMNKIDSLNNMNS